MEQSHNPGSSQMQQNNHDYYELKTEISLIKKDLSNFDQYFEKIGQTLDKLGIATEKLVQMLQLHDERIRVSKEEDIELKISLSKDRVEIENQFEKLKLEMAQDRINSTTQLEKAKDSVSEHIKENRTTLETIKKWMWTASGVGVAAWGILLALLKLKIL